MQNDHALENLKASAELVLVDLRDYLESEGDDAAGYTLAHVDQVGVLLQTFLGRWEAVAVGDKPAFDDSLRESIEGLNALNDSCDYCLIETDQRELLAELYNNAARFKEIPGWQEDVTENLRDW